MRTIFLTDLVKFMRWNMVMVALDWVALFMKDINILMVLKIITKIL
jgi:hypothetical protein